MKFSVPRLAFLLCWVAAAMALPGFASQAGAAPPDKVRVGAYSSLSDAGLYIAQDKGYFAEQGLAVEFVQVNTTVEMMTQLASGDLDVSGGAPAAGLYNAARQGIDELKIVADKGSTHPGHGYFAFVVRKDLADKIKQPSDMRGRLLAVTGYGVGANSEVTVGRLMQSGGVKENEVNQVNMQFADILAALGTGKVEIGLLIEPLATEAVEKGVGVIWKRADEIYPDQQYGALMYGPGITKRPDVARRFMIAYLKAVRFYNDALAGKASREELVTILTKNTSVKNPAIYRTMAFPGLDPNGKLNVEGMKADVKWWVAAGRMKESVPVEKLIDTSYAEQAAAALGPYQK
jgi:ABC-type nitrate/sulfonate/bicarbonate transport system substrate-binding protein